MMIEKKSRKKLFILVGIGAGRRQGRHSIPLLYSWAWIALILLLYAAPGCSVMADEAGTHLSLMFYITSVGLSKYRVCLGQGMSLKLYVPAGMILYWLLRKRLPQKSVAAAKERRCRA